LELSQWELLNLSLLIHLSLTKRGGDTQIGAVVSGSYVGLGYGMICSSVPRLVIACSVG
jgi:hypothetical protein